MEKKIRLKKESLLFAITLCIVCAVTLFWFAKKSDMFIDEIVTYGLSNSYYAPFISDVPEDRNLINKVLTREDFVEYLTVSESNAFRFDSVYYNQTQDTQPPLYYMLLHLMCSFFQGSYSKWIGLSINLLLYVGTLVLLYIAGKMILRNRKYAALAVLLYGLSFGGLSDVLMIRMYILLTFLTMCFACVVLKLYQGSTGKVHYLLVTLILFLGLFTQYFFVFFAFFISAVYCLRELSKKHFKEFIVYALSAFLGIAIFYISYPCVVDQLFADKLVSGQTAVGNMMDFRGMLLSIYSFIMQTAASYKAALLLLFVVLAAGVLRFRKTVSVYMAEFDIKDSSAIAIMISVIFAVLLTAVVSPVTALRYIYNVLPMAALIITYVMECAGREWDQFFYPFYILCILVCLWKSLTTAPDYVENIPKENFEIMEAYETYPCVYLDNDYDASITQDMLQLIKFPEIFITDDFLCEDTEKYLKKSDIRKGIILYIDVSEDWSSGYDSEKVLKEIVNRTEFRQYELLCSFSFSETYLLY